MLSFSLQWLIILSTIRSILFLKVGLQCVIDRLISWYYVYIYLFQVYDKLRKEQPNFHEKLVPVFGDITLPELGIKPEDLKLLCDNVNVVFHSAATIRFDEHLR